MKRITALIITAAMMLSIAVSAASFSDTDGHWAADEIDKAYSSGFVNGDGDGTFRPDDSVSRAEFIKMITALTAAKFDDTVPNELDDGTHWASKYYNFAAMVLVRRLTEDDKVGDVVPGVINSENADLPISRWEMAYIMSEVFANVFGRAADEAEYADKTEIEKVYPKAISDAVTNCIGQGIMKGDENGSFNPADNGTRAEAATLMNRASARMDELIEYFKTINQSGVTIKTFDEIPEGHPIVTVEMENGKSFKIELYPEYAPQTVANFVSLVKDGFYDGLTFHRVVKDFMAQGGDPEGTGMGGCDYAIRGEFSANGFAQNTLKHEHGTISMARTTDPDSASSQFFICYTDVPTLDGQYAAFGKVIEGMDTVDAFLNVKMEKNSMGEDAVPSTPIVMKKVTVADGK